MTGFDIVAWSEDVLQSLGGIAAVPETRYSSSGDNLKVPYDDAYLIGAIAIGSSSLEQARILPSGEPIEYDLLTVLNTLIVPKSPMMFVGGKLAKNQILTAEADNSGAAAAENITVLALIGDGVRMPFEAIPTQLGNFKKIKWIRGTGSTTLTVKTWTDVSLSFSDLESDKEYAIIGLAGWSAGAKAFRLTHPKLSPYEPGVPAGISPETTPVFYFAPGHRPVFRGDQPPNAKFLSVSADTSEEVFLLIGEM